MTDFDFSGIPVAPPPPPIDPLVAREDKIANDTRVESELNHFIAAKQDALFEAPDAYYRRQGRDAVDGAPQAIQRLHDIKDVLLDGLANDYQRKRLSTALDAHMTLASDDIGRHSAEQSKEWQRQTALDRIDLLAKEAGFHHADDNLIEALSAAAANAARAHARIGGASPSAELEDAAAAQARDRVFAAASQAQVTAKGAIPDDHFQEGPESEANDVRTDSSNFAQVSEDPRAAYRQCAAECSMKWSMGQMPRPKWFSGSDESSLMRICIRACLAEKGDFNY
jgi:hypothetical protein